MFIAQRHPRVWQLVIVCLGSAILGCQRSEMVTITSTDSAERSAKTRSGTTEAGLEQPVSESEPAAVPFFQARNWISEAVLPWDAWYVQYLRGQRIGYFRISVSQGTSLLRVRRSKLVEPVDGEEGARYAVELDSYEYADGRMASFEERTTGGDSSRIITGEFKRDELTLTTVEGDKKEKTILSWEEGTWGVLGIQSILLSQPMQPEEVRRVKLFLPNARSIETVNLVAGKWELASLPGGLTSELLPVEISSSEGSEFAKLKVWVDIEGNVKKSVTLEGTKISTFQMPEESAKIMADEYRLKAVLGDSVPFDGPLPDAGASTVTYLVQSSSLSMYEFWASNVRQVVKSNSALNFEITIQDVADLDAVASFANELPTQDDLASTPLIPSDDPVIESMAEKLVDSQDSTAAVVTKLTRGVRDQLDETVFSEHVLDSADAARQLRGDCSEHAMLLVALLRNRGIPARVASGLQLVPERRRLTYHMWTEAWMDGRWLPIDGTTGEVTSPRCIKMFDSSLATPNPYDVILAVFEKMPSIRIRAARER